MLSVAATFAAGLIAVGLPAHAAGAFTTRAYLPFLQVSPPAVLTCQSIPGQAYDAADSIGPRSPTDPPANQHPDLNLALRSYAATSASLGLVSYNGTSDAGAPQLPGLFGDNRTPAFQAVYRVYDWDWNCNCRGNLLTQWPVTLAGLGVVPGKIIYMPQSGYDIGSGYEALVLYASSERVTLKYTRDDNVVYGYTLHVENICVEPTLLALYQSWNGAGRSNLPALRAGQAIGRARGNQLGVAVRDTGTFMDPRSRNDWWRGR